MTDPSQQQILPSLLAVPLTFHPAVPLPLAVSLASERSGAAAGGNGWSAASAVVAVVVLLWCADLRGH